MIPHLLVSALGLWLMAAPAVLGYDGPAATSDRIAGPALAAIGYLAAFAITRGLRWLALPVGAWLLVGPWMIGFPTDATVNSVLVAVAVVALAPRGPADPSRYGGGWSAVFASDSRRG